MMISLPPTPLVPPRLNENQSYLRVRIIKYTHFHAQIMPTRCCLLENDSHSHLACLAH